LSRFIRIIYKNVLDFFVQHNLEEDNIPPPMIRCSYERFAETGAYVIGKRIFNEELIFI
jgi:hypothetical protein